MTTPERRAFDIISTNRYLALGTADEHGPWVAPVSYVWLLDGDLVFYSAVKARHSGAAHSMGQVAGAIYDSTASSDDADGIQFVAEFKEVTDAELPQVIDEYFLKSFPDPDGRARWIRPAEDFMGSAPQRFYRLHLVEAYVPDTASPKIDLRSSVNLDEVKSLRSSE